MEKILLVRLGGVGDVVCTLPALDALRAARPDAFIGYAVEDRSVDLVRGHPAVDKVHLFPRWKIVRQKSRPSQWLAAAGWALDYLREVRGEHYDVAVDLQRNFKGAMHGLLSGATRRIGFAPPVAREGSHWFTHERVLVSRKKHWADRFVGLLGALGAKPEFARYRLPEAPESRARVDAFLAENKLKDFIALHPTASPFDPRRRWEPERFGKVAEGMFKASGLRTVVTWGPSERGVAERTVAASGGSAMLCFATQSLLDLAELYRKARLYVGCDTGPMHVATAVGLPSVVLFGSGDPVAYGPRSAFSRIVSKKEGKRLAPLSRTTPAEVVSAALEVMAAASNRPATA